MSSEYFFFWLRCVLDSSLILVLLLSLSDLFMCPISGNDALPVFSHTDKASI